MLAVEDAARIARARRLIDDVRKAAPELGASAEADAPEPAPPPRMRPALDPAARYGLLGEIVESVEPHTEADPVAVLVALLVGFGNAVGRGPHTLVGPKRHGTNGNAVIVGPTSRGRKGTAQSEANRFLRVADESWANKRQAGGISSGEGLIFAVRDPIWGLNKQGEPVLIDAGVVDKRLMVTEEEFAGVLKTGRREGNTSTEVQRRAWDGDDLATMTRKDPLRATGPHISIIGHITADELRRTIDDTSLVNGYLNRCALVYAERSKLLPHGGDLRTREVEQLGRRLERALQTARQRGALYRTPAANRLWEAAYTELERDIPGLLGAITGRASAHVLRFSLLYALLDGAEAIDAPHVDAAVALWRYCEDSARFVFGDATGDPVADRVLSALRTSPGGMTQNDLGLLFGKNLRGGELARALEVLAGAGLARAEALATGGRPATIWSASVREGEPAARRAPGATPNGKNGIYGNRHLPDGVEGDLSRISRLSRSACPDRETVVGDPFAGGEEGYL